MAGPISAESSKSKRGPKVLSHLEIHPALGGGHTVKHVYQGYEHEPKPYKFAKDEGDRAAKHVLRHAGLPVPTSHAETEGETEAEEHEGEIEA